MHAEGPYTITGNHRYFGYKFLCIFRRVLCKEIIEEKRALGANDDALSQWMVFQVDSYCCFTSL